MDVREIPWILWQEFAENVRKEDVTLAGQSWEELPTQVRESLLALQGQVLTTIGNIKGAEKEVIEFCENEAAGITSVKLWACEGDVQRGLPILEIRAGKLRTDVSEDGRELYINMAVCETNGSYPLGRETLFAAAMLRRASELALSAGFD